MEKGILIDDLILRSKKDTENFIRTLEYEEKIERVETLDQLKNEMKADTLNTQIKKRKFAEELRSGLLDEIKSGGGIVKIEKKPESLIKKFFNLFVG
jgi:hypothetical protein